MEQPSSSTASRRPETGALAACVLGALVAAAPLPSRAVEAYPEKPLRLVVPFAPGGTNDTVGRLLAESLGAVLGQTIIVENRGGAATNIGSEYVARSPPEGYTLLLGSSSSAANVTLYPKLPFLFQRDFAPVTLVASTSQVLVIHPAVPARSVRDFIRIARGMRGQLTYASAGIASPPHLAGALFNALTGIQLVHVPYKGGGPAVISVMSGETFASFAGTTSALPHIRGGRLRALGVTTSRRVAVAPEIPTIAEAGVHGYEMAGWIALFAPRATPARILDRLNGTAVTVLGSAELRERFRAVGVEAEKSSREELAAFVTREVDNYARIIRGANIQPQ